MSRFLLLIVLASLTTSVFADEQYCSEDWACAGFSRSNKGIIEYWVANKKPYPVTITLEVKTSNLQNIEMQARRRWEVTTVLQGMERRNVLQLMKILPKKKPSHDYDFSWIPGDMYAQHDNNYRYQLPFADDADYRVVQGYNGGYSHQGASKFALDFAMPVGTPIHAARPGVVIDLKQHHWRGGAARRYAKYANFVVILHDDGTTGEYYHLKQNGVLVNIGDEISLGQHIGYSGNTGFSSLPHLHFAVYRARSHGKFESIPVTFTREPNTWRRRGLGKR